MPRSWWHHGGVIDPRLSPAPAGVTRLVFVCAGNICRSVLAARLYAGLQAEGGHSGPPIISRGLVANPGEGPQERTIRAARLAGIELHDHRATRLDPAELRPGDLVVVMEDAQRAEVVARSAAAASHVQLLGRFSPDHADEVDDPGEGHDRWEDYTACVAHIEAAVRGLSRWLGRSAGAQSSPESPPR